MTVEELIQKLKPLGVPYIPIAVEAALVPFYEKCGFKVANATAMNISFSDDKS